jgi:hypothetical protein
MIRRMRARTRTNPMCSKVLLNSTIDILCRCFWSVWALEWVESERQTWKKSTGPQAFYRLNIAQEYESWAFGSNPFVSRSDLKCTFYVRVNDIVWFTIYARSSPLGPASQISRKCCVCPTLTPSPYSILMELSLLMRMRLPDPLLALTLSVEASLPFGIGPYNWGMAIY